MKHVIKLVRGAAAAAALLSFARFAFGQWENLNPGGGGQIQGITMDPNTLGRMYLNSDVEGNYRSDDYGQTWTYIGKELIHHMAFFVEVEPGNSQRIYSGGLYGLHLSNNAGTNWTVVPALKGIATAAMAIDPTNVNNLYVGNSWYIKDAQMPSQKQPGESTTGSRIIYYSKDRGSTWQTRTYEATTGYKQCYTISISPVNANTVFIGTAAGLYRSTDGGNSWSKISPPSGQPSCRGADITPDGAFIYAAFGSGTEAASPSRTNVYVAPVSAGTAWTWTAIATPASPNGLYYASGVQTYYWKPRIDPRSSSTVHRVVIGCMASNANTSQGLYQFTGSVAGNSVSGSWSMTFGNTAAFDYDVGWNNVLPQVRQYQWTPNSASWPSRILLASQQSLYYGDPSVANGTVDKWLLRSSQPYNVFGSYITYRTRGFQSTVNYDAAAYGNYVIQGMADNRVLESWDDGLSWTQDSRPGGGQNGDYVDVIPPNGTQPAMAITACGGGFGGANDTADASHWAKKLSTPASSSDTWVSLETGTSGLPTTNSRTYASAYNPANPKQVVIATYNGLYETTDIYARYDGTGGAFSQIGGTVVYKQGNVWWDPVNTNTIYAKGQTGIRKGVKSGSSWAFTTLVSGVVDSAWYWKYNNTDYIAYAINDTLYLSSDGGASFTQVLNQAGMLAVHSEPWWGTWADGTSMALQINGVAGYQNKIVLGSEEPSGKHGYAMFMGTIQANGSVVWSDWSGTPGTSGYMEVARLWDGKIVPQNGKTYYYAATRGSGTWRREIASSQPVTVTLTSQGANDGYVTESTEGSNVGGSNAVGGTGSAALRIGDTATNQQVKTIVSFDTSSIPVGATITSVTLRLKRGSSAGTTPFSTHGQCRVDVKTGSFGLTTLENSDFEATASAIAATTLSAPAANGDWASGDLSAAGIAAINRSGVTQFRVYFSLDDDNDSTRDDVGFYPGEGAAGTQPELIVTYVP